MKTCTLPNCDRKYFSTGKCKLHYGKKWYKDNPEASVHLNMKARCFRENHPEYKDYGARGITVCDRWRFGENGKTGFRCFMDDMGKRPSKEYSIDRINNDGNYEPHNCRWTTLNVQSINKRPSLKSKTGHTGVVYIAKMDRWYAHLKANKVHYRLGYFKTKQEAVEAREKAEVKYHKPLLEGAIK